MRSRAGSESFEKFYYNNVALGEGCGCAEKVIDVYDAKAGAPAVELTKSHSPSLRREIIEAFVIRLALIRGKKAPDMSAAQKK
jgi:hypothetical protein